MADFTPQIAPEVLAACAAGAGEASAALARTFDAPITLAVGASGALDVAAPPPEWNGPGLAVVLNVGTAGALLLLPESSGLLPEWYAAPDATGKSKLTTLAQELGMLLLPEEFMPDDFQAARVGNLGAALEQAQAATGAGLVSLTLSAADRTATAHLVWPVAAPTATYAVPAVDAAPASDAPAADSAAASSNVAGPPETAAPRPAPPAAAPSSGAAAGTLPDARPAVRLAGFEDLPPYARSLLRIQVPVTVTVARTRLGVQRITELVPGTIIQFNKSCEEMLELCVGNQPVAMGEAVKVGEKFGLRLTSILLPDERFRPVGPSRSAG